MKGGTFICNGDQPCISIRQAALKKDGEGLVLAPPKSKESRRDVPISTEMADELRKLLPLQRSPVFQNEAGKMLNPDNLYARVLRPAMSEAGIDKGGFHTFRHTVATRLFAEGRNVVQVQKFLGHSDPAFTLKTYIHLLDDDLGGPIRPLRDNSEITSCTNPDEIEHLDFPSKSLD